MLFFQRHSRFWHPKYLLVLACFFFICMVPTVGSGKSKGQAPLTIPDEAIDFFIRSDPSYVYPDAQSMKDVSGHLTAIFRAQGSYTFHSQTPIEKKTCTTQVSLDLTMTIEYIRSGNSELITSTLQGVKRTIYNQPSEGRDPKIYHYGTGNYYNPSTHQVTTESYTGSTSRKTYGAVKSVIWSKEQKLACFRIGLGDMQEVIFMVPGKIHIEEDKAIDDDHHRQSWDSVMECRAFIPSHSTANTRFAHLVNNRGGLQLEMLGGWIEVASPQGTTNGSFTMPLFFDGISWLTDESYHEAGEDPRRVPERDIQLIWPGSVQVNWAFGDKIPEGKMTIAAADQAAYNAWYPIPVDDQRYGLAAKLEFTARIEPKEKDKPAPKGKIHFWLCDISRNKGKCNNFPRDGAAKDDLRFAPNQAGLIIDPQNPRHAYTEKPCETATVEVEALDTGAYGNLQATCDDLGLVAEDERTKLQSISIPMDDNHNHVADVWEKEKGIKGEDLPADWDEDAVAGQKSKGDSITLYQSYRGFMVLREGKPVFTRLEPKQKVLFIIDDGNIFDTELWFHASGIKAYKLNDSLVKGGATADPASRIVDFNGGDGGHKYCVRLIKQQGLVESPPYKDQPPGDLDVCGYTDKGNSPKEALRCVIFPARIRAMIDRVASYVANGVKDPSSKDGKSLAKTGIPVWLAQKALDRLDQTTRDQLTKQMVTLCAIHEMGHACCLDGHLNDKGNECESGDPKCPMKYMDRADDHRLLILQVIFALDHPLPLQYDHFCKEGYNCYGELNVKD